MLHSFVLKKVGAVAMCIGIAAIIILTGAFFTYQQYAVVWGYFITAGVYFVLIGMIIWIVGAAKEYRESKKELLPATPTDQAGDDEDD